MLDKNILVVDDIITNRILLKETLRVIKCNYFEAKNGKEALDVLQKEKIDLILMDIEMPVMNGLETTKYIREKLSFPLNKIPIIALTAHNPYNFFDEFEDAGFDELMTKPYSIEKVKEKIKFLINL